MVTADLGAAAVTAAEREVAKAIATAEQGEGGVEAMLVEAKPVRTVAAVMMEETAVTEAVTVEAMVGGMSSMLLDKLASVRGCSC